MSEDQKYLEILDSVLDEFFKKKELKEALVKKEGLRSLAKPTLRQVIGGRE
jgi:hypothetical protein